MDSDNLKSFIKSVLKHMPKDWYSLTTHRLDIYKEEFAKTEFLTELEKLKDSSNVNNSTLSSLPTAYDYIRLGHPLSCLLEWGIAKSSRVEPTSVVSFSSQAMPVLAILRKNLLDKVKTKIYYNDQLPENFDIETLKIVYGYDFEIIKVNKSEDIKPFSGSNIFIAGFDDIWSQALVDNVDFKVNIHSGFGSIVLVKSSESQKYISEIQHVRRRESIAMTPECCLSLLTSYSEDKLLDDKTLGSNDSKKVVLNKIREITNTLDDAVLGSCGLSIQYAIMMGLIHHSLVHNKGKSIKLIVPPNCYGGTNDQARRVAACVENVEVLDLPVDSGQNMVQSVEKVLSHVASIDAIPFIIAEIPTNPRVEVPDLGKLRDVLSKVRKTELGEVAVAPVFILDQTFCPNVKFLGAEDILSSVKTISYVSGSKFPSGGLCTAGYCVANLKAQELMSYIDKHLKICDNEATALQVDTLAKQMPSMIDRISDAYKNTREFVNHIRETLPAAKINFVSEELAKDGFTPSVFSLDLPTKGSSLSEKENYKRDLNLKLITMMIEEISDESKHCVSYGQLKGCYWTIPATSTQGTTKEGDKDYIVRVSVSPNMNIELHKEVFTKFCSKYI